MFTTGRVIFIVVFLLIFIVGMIYAYRKDMKYEKKWYRGSWKILLAVLAIAVVYYVLSRI